MSSTSDRSQLTSPFAMSIGGKEFVGPYRMFHLIRAGALFEIWAVRPVAETKAFAMKWLPPGQHHTRQNVAALNAATDDKAGDA